MPFNDNPIESISDDLLHRNNFVNAVSQSIINYPQGEKSITISINGGWGTGKSTILNFIEEEIREEIKILRFNPWIYSSQNNLIKSFFNELTVILKKDSELYEKLKLDYYKYKHKLFKSAIEVGTYAHPPIQTLSNFLKDESETLDELKNNLQSFLKGEENIVVIIDDIDRLTPDEVKQVFQLVKSLADFPNIIYILAFDIDYVNNALKDWNLNDDNNYHSEDFINKIIQVPLKIPLMDNTDFFNIFSSKFKKLLKNHNINQKIDIEDLFSYLNPFFNNIRDINRYMNSLDFYLYSVKDEIYIYDFALITCLQIFSEEVYNEISKNKTILLRNSSNIYGTFDKYLNEFSREIVKNTENHTKDIKMILSKLFPNLRGVYERYYPSENQINHQIKNGGIINPNYFDFYFTFHTKDNLISKARLNSIISSATDEEIFKEQLFILKEEQLINKLFNQLSYHASDFNALENENYMSIIMNYADKFGASDERKIITPGTSAAICDFIHKICDEINDAIKIKEFLEKHIRNSENSYFKCYLVWYLNKMKYCLLMN